ncbi:MAG TPA: hypothetical protein VJY62_22525 [Bacteroidia bacterium]|nr:hypothetical protein [Bacteroidia bacterium]
MKKISIKKNQYLSIITVCVVGAIAAFYMLAYIPQAENDIITQRFRTLHRIDKNIHEKIENSKVTLGKILEGSVKEKGNTQRFINSLPKDDFLISEVTCSENSIPSSLKNKGSNKKDTTVFDKLNSNPANKKSAGNNPDSTRNKKQLNRNKQAQKESVSLSGSADVTTEIKVQDNEKKFLLTSTKGKCEVSMTYTFESFIKPLLRKNVFDEYVVLSKEGNTVYEEFPAGISFTSKDSLFITKNKVTTSTFRPITIGGIDYKMFLQPVRFDTTNEWIVAGLLTSDRFNSEKRELPASWVLALMLTALIGIILLPWLKLAMMGNREKMNIADGISSFVSALLLMSFIFLVFVKYNYSFRPDQTDSKRVLGKQIENNIKRDITLAVNQMKKFDSLFCADTLYRRDFVKLPVKTVDSIQWKKNIATFKNSVSPPLDSKRIDTLVKSIRSFTLSSVFWIDSTGKDRFNWNSDAINPSKASSLLTRDYYVQLKRKNTFSFPVGQVSDFYITQMISPTYNQFRTYISRESGCNGFVEVMSFDLSSLANTVMPDGYSFAVINNQGDVRYHADSTLNLNENFIEECSEKTKLISAISSKTEGRFESKYYGQNYKMLVRPIKNLPYFVVVMSDMRFDETRDKEAFGFTLSMMMALFFFLCLIYFIMYKASVRKGKLIAISNVTEWVLPRYGMRGCYILAFAANILVIALLICFMQRDASFMTYLFIMLSASVMSPLFLNLLYWNVYYAESKKADSSDEKLEKISFNNARLRSYKMTSVIVLSSLLLVIEISAFVTLDKTFEYFAFQLCSLAVFTSLFIASPYLFRKYISHQGKINSRINYVRFYSLMAVSSLIISSGFPVMLFYTQSYDFEQNLIISYKHSLFAEKLKSKFDLSRMGRVLKSETVPPHWAGIYVDSSWIRKIEIDSNKKIESFIRKSGNDIISDNNIFNGIRVRLEKNELAVSSDNFYNSIALDSSRVYYATDPVFGSKDFVVPADSAKNDTLFIKGVIAADDTSRKPANDTSAKKDTIIINGVFSYKDTYMKIFVKITCSIDTASQKNDTIVIRNIIPVKETSEENDTIVIGRSISINEITAKKDSLIIEGIFIHPVVTKGIISVFKLNGADTDKSVYIKIKSGTFNYAFPDISTAQGFIYWLLLTVVLFIFYQVIAGVVSRLFALKIPDFINFRSMEGAIISEAEAYKLLFIIGLPGAGKARVLKKYLDPPQPSGSEEKTPAVKYVTLNMINIPDSSGDEKETTAWETTLSDAFKSNCRCFVIDHFEYNLINVNASRGKLKLLIKLMADPANRIIILSSIELNVFLQALMEQNSLNEADAKMLKEDFARWNILLGHFKTLYVPLQKNELKTKPRLDFEIEKTLYRECRSNHFLEKIYESWITHFRNSPDGKKNKNDRETAADLIYELQNLAHHAYRYLWDSLSPEEKFIVHDLAEEGLVNSYDSYRLGVLIKKGVIVRRSGTLGLFNISFRNFVLTSISRQDEQNIIELMKDEGSWSKFKTPLIVGIVAILIFLLSSQKEIFNQVLTILGALAAGIPVVIKFLTMGGSKSEDKK